MRKGLIKDDKRGVIGLIILLVILVSVVILGFMASMVLSITDVAIDQLVPAFDSIGTVGNSNMTEYSGYTLHKVQDIVTACNWAIGTVYVLALVGTIIFAMSMRINPHPVFIGVYFSMMLLMIVFTILMSNMYEDIYEDDTVISTRLQDQPLISYMILFSPLIMTIIMIFSGIFLFARPPEAGGVI